MALAVCSFALLRSSALLRYFPLVFFSTRHRTRPQRSYQHRLSSVRPLRHKLISSAHSNSLVAFHALFPSGPSGTTRSLPRYHLRNTIKLFLATTRSRVKGFRRFRVVIYFRPRGSSEECGESRTTKENYLLESRQCVVLLDFFFLPSILPSFFFSSFHFTVSFASFLSFTGESFRVSETFVCRLFSDFVAAN